MKLLDKLKLKRKKSNAQATASTASTNMQAKGRNNPLKNAGSAIIRMPRSIINMIKDNRLMRWIGSLNRNYLIAGTLLVVLTLWMLSGTASQEEVEPIDTEARSATNMKSVLVQVYQNEETERIIRLSGITQEERSVEIKAELTGQVESIIALEGSEVAESESILQLEETEAVARLRQAQAAENRAELEYNSQRRLLSQGLTSEASMSQELANFEAARASVALAEQQFESTKVQAPFAGTVERIFVDEGDFVQPGQNLASVFDYDPILVIGDLSEREVDFIQIGSLVDITLANGDQIQGDVTFVARAADINSRTFRVEVSVPNPDRSILAGITAEMEFLTGFVPATKIPASIIAIDDNGDLGIKGVNQQNQVVFYPIEVVKAETNEMWVSMLPDGARIITRGFGFVAEEEEVVVTLDEDNAQN